MDSRITEIVSEFKSFHDWESRYKHLISLGKSLPEMKEEHKIETNKVKGCQSQVWLFAELEDGKIKYSGDSDASIVKGIVALLLKIYGERTPTEILTLDQGFVDEIGLKQHLSMSRANGLSAMMKQIQMYAVAYKAKMDLGVN
ncbi:MAG: SufE family protein [Halobacteriovoraceae bacterium]|nr:SufE family protein [Halobacteriovoraceae bacterium]